MYTQSGVKAHGKVILGGEHAVVHGCLALAAAIPNALELVCTPDAPSDALHLEVPHWQLHRVLPREVQPQEDRLDTAIRALFVQAGVQPWGHRILGHTTLPSGAGLGSSAALCVGLAKLALGPLAPEQDLYHLSMIGERVFHGDPSGIDSQLAVYGGLFAFRRGDAPAAVSLSQPLRLCIVSSQTPRQSADQVAKVQAMVLRHPTLGPPTWALFSAQVQAMQQALQAHERPHLGELMNMQHHLLGTLGVSTAQLDTICACARKAGALGAKLTGAGGGGCVLVLPPQDRPGFSQDLQSAMQTHMSTVFPHFFLEIPAS